MAEQLTLAFTPRWKIRIDLVYYPHLACYDVMGGFKSDYNGFKPGHYKEVESFPNLLECDVCGQTKTRYQLVEMVSTLGLLCKACGKDYYDEHINNGTAYHCPTCNANIPAEVFDGYI